MSDDTPPPVDRVWEGYVTEKRGYADSDRVKFTNREAAMEHVVESLQPVASVYDTPAVDGFEQVSDTVWYLDTDRPVRGVVVHAAVYDEPPRPEGED